MLWNVIPETVIKQKYEEVYPVLASKNFRPLSHSFWSLIHLDLSSCTEWDEGTRYCLLVSGWYQDQGSRLLSLELTVSAALAEVNFFFLSCDCLDTLLENQLAS